MPSSGCPHHISGPRCPYYSLRMPHHDGCYGVPHLSRLVRQKGSLDTHSWQVILMSSISPIRPVINNSISARPTQTDKRNTSTRGRAHSLTKVCGVLMKRVMGISVDGCLWSRGGVCPRAALSCELLAATWSLQIVPSPFISSAPAENLKGCDKIHLRGVGADCLEQVL